MSDKFLDLTTFLFLLNGLGITLLIAVFTIIASFVLGCVLGISKFTDKGILSKVSAVYIDVARNLPLILVIIFFRF